MTNILTNLQFNEVISISAIIILYEFVVLILYLCTIIDKKTTSNLLSWAIVLNFFIIFVMFLTDCKVDTTTKICVVIVKTILLFIVLFIANFSFQNYFIGLVFILIYFVFSNINKVYSCNVKMINLVTSFLLSTTVYFGTMYTQIKH
jgi:hypothetical protein